MAQGDNFMWDPDGVAFRGETSDAFFQALYACEITTFSFDMGEKPKDDTATQAGGDGGTPAKPGVNRGLPAGIKQGGSFQRGKSGSGSSVGGAKGKASLGSLKITKFLDSASTSFYQYCCLAGEDKDDDPDGIGIIPTINIAVRKSGGDRLIYLQYCFRANEVTAVSWTGGEGSQRPVENITIEFKAMAMAYERQSSGASLETDQGGEDPGSHHEWTWNVTQTGDAQTNLTINGVPWPKPFLDPHEDIVVEYEED